MCCLFLWKGCFPLVKRKSASTFVFLWWHDRLGSLCSFRSRTREKTEAKSSRRRRRHAIAIFGSLKCATEKISFCVTRRPFCFFFLKNVLLARSTVFYARKHVHKKGNLGEVASFADGSDLLSRVSLDIGGILDRRREAADDPSTAWYLYLNH